MMAQDPRRDGTLLQAFEWHTHSSSAGRHYRLLLRLLPQFAAIGITALWLPPGCKANNSDSNGYDIYDLWDLGEFEQKGARSTKWGSKLELDELINKAKELDIEIIWDAVVSHKQAGDSTQQDIWAVEVDKKEQDRRYEICPPKQIEAWLRYDFPGREAEGMKYSGMKWRAEHFNGTDWDQSAQKNAIYKLIDYPSTHPRYRIPNLRGLARLRRHFSVQPPGAQSDARPPPPRRPGKGWAEDLDDEHGNNDYLMFSNIDYTHPEVRADTLRWGTWMVHETGVQGFRVDAAQHISYKFMREWIQRVQAASLAEQQRDVFVVGEVWTADVRRILRWLDAMQHRNGPQVYAFDSPLLYNFSRISEGFRMKADSVDLRAILSDSLLFHRPRASMTAVTNHDTQPGQASATPMHSSLKPLFYAFILLRRDGYPCVFWGDLFGTGGPHAEAPACTVRDGAAEGQERSLLPDLVLCRKLFAHGEQVDYWDMPTCIGWTRLGMQGKRGMAVVLNIGSTSAVKCMRIGRPGEVWRDALGQVDREVEVDVDGIGLFPCKKESVSVFVRKTDLDGHIFPVIFNIKFQGHET